MAFDHALWAELGTGAPPPSQAGRYSGPLLILGGGRTVWDDLAAVGTPPPSGRGHPRWKGEVMAVNDVGAHYQGILRHWVTLHPDYLPGWMQYRRGHNLGEGKVPLTHSQARRSGTPAAVAWPIAPRGTSGLYACLIGLLLGYEPVVLAGIPFDNTGHYFDDPRIGTGFADRAQKLEWIQAKERWFRGRVTSCSGWTRELLGAPAEVQEQQKNVDGRAKPDHDGLVGASA